MAKILIVDDRPVNRQLLREILKYDHEISEAADGAEALETAFRVHPELIITDILMPTMDGYELVRRLHADGELPHCPIIFYTAYYHEREARALAKQSGVSRVLYKPCDPRTVLEAVAEALHLASSPAPARAVEDREFRSVHRRLLTDKLAGKAVALEVANGRLNALIEFGLQLASEEDPQRILKAGCRSARGIVGAKGAMLGLLDEGLSRLQQLICVGAATRAEAEALFSRLQGSVLSGALAKRRSFRLADPVNLFADSPALHSLLAVPVFSPKRAYGWLVLWEKTALQEFSAESERLVAMIAGKVAGAYENRKYFIEVQQHALQLEKEVVEREEAEEKLRSAHDLLEQRVRERTEELTRTVAALQTEIAEREKAEEALSASAAEILDLYHNAPCGYHSLDREGTITRINQTELDWLGYGAEEVVGRMKFPELLAPDSRRIFTSNFQHLKEAGEARDLEYELLHRDGRVLPVLMSATAMRDAGGGFVGSRATMFDITKLKKALEELRQKDQLLIQQTRLAAMGEMIGNIAHQWRQPLNNLGLVVQELALLYEMELLEEGVVAERTGLALELVRHMSQTIDDFRSFFKPDREKLLFSVNETLGKALALAEGSFKQGDIAIKVDAPAEVSAYGYANEFSQVLLNIFSNARDAHGERKRDGSQVAVRLFSGEETAVVTVTDNAGGIAEELLPKIFEPYFSTKGPQGTGIGLYMAKTIIEKNMSGRILAHNTSDGMEFRIELPSNSGQPR